MKFISVVILFMLSLSTVHAILEQASDIVGDDALKECKRMIEQKKQECQKYEGWSVDVQVSLKNKKTGEEKSFDEQIQGPADCPFREQGEGAGNSRPLNIKANVIDRQGTQYELVCNVACYGWNCPKTILGQEDVAFINKHLTATTSALAILFGDQTMAVLVDDQEYSIIFHESRITSLTEGFPAKPTIRMALKQKTFTTIKNSKEPLKEFVTAINNGNIIIIGETVGTKIKAALASISASLYLRQLANEFSVEEGEQRIVTVAGTQGVLTQNELGQRVVTTPQNVFIVSSYGNPVAYSTPGTQALINQNPVRYSNSAGVYYGSQQQYFVPAPFVLQPTYDTFIGGGNFVFLGGGGFAQ